MSDTPESVQILFRRLLLQRSPEERLLMGFRMFDASRVLVRASLGDTMGTGDSPQLREQLFLRTYGQDFDAATRERIITRIRQDAQRGPAAKVG